MSENPIPAASRLLVDLGALVANYRSIARGTAAECAGVVKANAYGLGLAEVSHALVGAGCETLFTAFTAEAVALRSLVPDRAIYVLSPVTRTDGATLAAHRLTPCLYDLDGVDRWLACTSALGTKAVCALHVETGINRLGMSAAEVEGLAVDPGPRRRLGVELVMSHLASADEPDARANRDQRERFIAIRRRFPGARASLANTAGTFLGADFHFDLVRPGIGVFGHDPHGTGRVMPVATFESTLGQVKHLRRGEAIGYGETFICPRDMRVGVILAGYADGVRRVLSSCDDEAPMRAWIGGHDAPVLGRVSMDMTVVDLTAVPDAAARPGAPVELFGAHVPIESVAARADTIPYEILTGLGGRVRREYVNGPAGD